MVKCVFSIPLSGPQEFVNSICKLVSLPLSCLRYSCINKRAQTVNVTFKTKNKGSI
ncbi:Mobile element protein [Candidatus Enterovibrio altilux]|uniref:Mobile element protein n=1 Tax=Candidatus Enterovibrio altilux TaxID=1927128 RepID=A0A291B8M7_9GAMM|nr:Mobile element protein [Candidatus Enterovibrio luxaltus]